MTKSSTSFEADPKQLSQPQKLHSGCESLLKPFMKDEMFANKVDQLVGKHLGGFLNDLRDQAVQRIADQWKFGFMRCLQHSLVEKRSTIEHLLMAENVLDFETDLPVKLLGLSADPEAGKNLENCFGHELIDIIEDAWNVACQVYGGALDRLLFTKGYLTGLLYLSHFTESAFENIEVDLPGSNPRSIDFCFRPAASDIDRSILLI